MRGSKLREAILQHEIGHLKLQAREPENSTHLRRDMMNKKIHTDVVMNHGIGIKDPATGKNLADASGREIRKTRKQKNTLKPEKKIKI